MEKVSWEGFKLKEAQIIGPVDFRKDIEVICISAEEIETKEGMEGIFSFTKIFGIPYRLIGE